LDLSSQMAPKKLRGRPTKASLAAWIERVLTQRMILTWRDDNCGIGVPNIEISTSKLLLVRMPQCQRKTKFFQKGLRGQLRDYVALSGMFNETLIV
jgi:hypothetical protein